MTDVTAGPGLVGEAQIALVGPAANHLRPGDRVCVRHATTGE
ncbi:MAG TPA: hypothetical protein VIL44_09785 [Micromonospora sp.]